MPVQKELLTDDQWHEEKRKFKENLVDVEAGDRKPFSQVIYEMCEECFLMGEVFGGDVLTDEEVKHMNQRAEEKIINHRNHEQ